MTTFDSFLYGLVQGLTEYLPVSSSAHLVLLPHFLGETDPGLAFDVFLHLGTFLATAIYFFSDWMLILKNPVPKENVAAKSLSWIHLIVGTLPAVVVGVVLNHWIQDNTRSLKVLWVTLPLFGVLLWAVDRFQTKTRKMTEATYRDLFLIGCAQAVALIPGVSRSGSTITASRALGFSRGDSLRISFLLSLPVTLGAIVYELRHWNDLVASVSGFGPLLVGCVSSLVFGAVAIKVMMTWVARTNFAVFAVYRFILAIVIGVYLK